MSSYDRIVEEGLQRGISQGREQGRDLGLEQGRRLGVVASLRQLLTLRFGPLDEDVIARLDVATLPTLETWTGRVLTAERLADVFA